MTQTLTHTLSHEQINSLNEFAHKVNRLSADFLAFDSCGDCVIEAPVTGDIEDTGGLSKCVRSILDGNHKNVMRLGDHCETIAHPLSRSGQTVGVAIIRLPACDTPNSSAANAISSRSSSSDAIIDCPIHKPPQDIDYFEEILSLFAGQFASISTSTVQLEKVCTELSQTYEELMLLYNLSSHMKVTQSSSTYLQLACDQLTQLVNVQGIAIFLEKQIDGGKRLCLTAGSGLVAIDPDMADILQVHLAAELNKGKDALLDSNVDSGFKYDWPEGIRSLIAVPLNGSDHMIGLMVATNIVDKLDFDTIDVKLFNSVAHQCAVFLENGRLFGDLKELFVGSLKALTNSIDAKDQYTRGHSERVAFISRWITDRISEKTPMPDEEVHRIYLAGLLHDIGKIGISEAVLRKKGRLDDDEMARIKAHPQIGASILSEIKQMKEIIPGILCHHERMDGKGYPKGLTGDKIPLIGKIICLADSFDAMTSRRVYREALSIKRAVAEIKKGIGTQFDPDVANAFVNSDIRKLWSIIQDGFIESWDYSNFSEYGAVAVGTLIR